MALASRAKYRDNLKRVRSALGNTYKKNNVSQAAVIVGPNKVKIGGQYYNAQVSGTPGTVVSVTNIGRPGAVLYSNADSGIVAQPNNTSVSGGGGGGSSIDENLLVFRDGRNSVTGDLSVDAGVTVDGVDISAHAANANAHHNRQHSITGTLDHTVTGSTLDVVGLSATNTLGILTPSAAPGAVSALLRSTSAGQLTLPLFVATTKLTTPLIETSSGNLRLAPAADVDIDGADLTGDSWSISAAGLAIMPEVRTPLLTTTGNANLVINPAGTGEVKFPDDQTLGSVTFDSSFPIAGWQINEHPDVSGKSVLTIGEINADELAVRVFVADETRVDRGDEYWTKSYGILAEPFTTPASIGGNTTVKFEDSAALTGAIFTNNDWVLIRKLDIDSGLTLYSIWGQVSGYLDNGDGTQDWTFTLRSGPTEEAIAKGAIAIDFGASGAALIHLSVTDSTGAPYIKMRRWAGANPYTPSNFTTYVQIGNLSGISNSYVTPAGDGLYLRSPANEGQVILLDNNGLQIRNTDLKLYEGATQHVNIDSAGTNVWIGNGSADKKLYWNGSTLAIEGTVVVTGGSGIASFTDAGPLVEAENLDDIPNGSTYGRVSSTIIAGGLIQVGSGTKDSTLSGWHISTSEIVGQASGADQVTMGTDGLLTAGAGAVWLDEDGVGFLTAAAGSDPNYMRWETSGGTIKGRIGYYYTAGPLPDPDSGLFLWADESLQFLSYGKFASGIDVTGDITVGGTVDGIDIAAFKSDYDSHDHDGTYLRLDGGTLTSGISTRNLIPSSGDTYTLGSSSLYYNHIYVRNLHTDTIVGVPDEVHAHDGLYVAVNGDTMTNKLTLQFDNFQMIELDRRANASVDSLFYVGVSFSGSGDFAFLGRSNGLQVYEDGSAMVDGNLVWHAGNDGVGSGLNADQLDGYHASSFSLTSHSHTHPDTSSQSSINGSAGVVIQDISVDTYGHVTLLGTVDLDDRYALAGEVGGGDVPSSRTITAGSGLTGGGSLTSNITISHADTSTQGSINGSGGFAIQDVTLDGFGHVTALAAVNLDSRYMQDVSAGSGITITGTAPTLTIAHADTSTQSSVNNSGGTFIQDITLDTYGHITAIVSASAGSVLDGNYLALTGGTLTGGLSGTTLTMSGAITAQSTLAVTGTTTLGAVNVGGAAAFTGSVAFNPGSAGAPFTIGANGQGQTVTGLKAEQLDVTLTAGTGLSGGGALTTDRSVAVDLTYAFTWTGQHTFSPGSVQAPFALNANAQGVTVTGLKADQLNKSVTAGDGLSGGGALTAGISLAVDSSVARRDAANSFTGNITIDKTSPALLLDNQTTTWEILGTAGGLTFAEDAATRLTVGAIVDIDGGLTVDTDTLVVSTSQKAVWLNSGNPSGEATFKVTSTSNEYITAVFRQKDGQTSEIMQWQDNTGAGMIEIDNVGHLQSVSTAFVSGRSGWRISPDGNAEFNNIVARGEIRTALFTKEEIAVDSGSHLFTEGGVLLNEFTVASGSLNLDIKDPASGHAAEFSVGDNLYIKGPAEINFNIGSGGGLHNPALWFMPQVNTGTAGVLVTAETWLEVTAITDMTTYFRYTVEYRGGTYATYPANSVVASYHQGGQGMIGIYADKTFGPYLDVFIPSATPWLNDERTTVRLGRLDGLGISGISSEQYGIAIGTDLSDNDAPRIVASDQQFSLYNIDLTIANSSGIGVQLALDDDSYFGAFMYDYGSDYANIGQIRNGALVETQSYIQYYLSTVGGSINTFDMRGQFQFYPLVNDETQKKTGTIYTYLPNHYRYISGLQTGFAIGSGSFEQPSSMMKAWYTGSSSWKMAGYVSGNEHWSVDSTGKWVFGDDLVRITQSGIRLSAVDTSIADPIRQLYWQTENNEIVASVTGYKEYDGSSVLKITADNDNPQLAMVTIGATSDLTQATGLSYGYNDSTSEAFMRIFAPLTLWEQSAAPPAPDSGGTLYIDPADGYLKIIFANSTVKTIATNV